MLECLSDFTNGGYYTLSERMHRPATAAGLRGATIRVCVCRHRSSLRRSGLFRRAPHGSPPTHCGAGQKEDRRQDDRTADARALFLSGIALKQVAANLPEGDALASAADQAIADWEDDYCGTPPRPLPTLALAVDLAAFASTLEVGDLQAAIQEEAGRIAQKAFAPAQAAQPTVVKAA